MRSIPILFIILASCTAGAPPFDTLRLSSGAPLTTLASSEATAVLLIIDPADCLSCSSVLPAWLEWRRQNPDRFHLILSRAPTPAEERMINIMRIPVDDSLAASTGARFQRLPIEVIVSSDEVLYADSLLTGRSTSKLLHELRNGSSISEFLRRVSRNP